MRSRFLALAFSCSAGIAAAQQDTPARSDEPVRETRREFLDSLADSAIAPDPKQLYRREGRRREIDLGGGFTAMLDEREPSRLGSPVATPGIAGAPSRVIGFSLRRPGVFGDLVYSRTAVTHENALALRRDFAERFALLVDWRDLRSDVAAVNARRRDSGASLRWDATPGLWLDAGVHHASIGAQAAELPSGADASATFWRARGHWQPASIPGLALGVRAERTTSPDGPHRGGTLELVADYTLAGGARAVWRESPKLGLLSGGEALEPAAAYHRSIGLEWPDGSPGGVLYTQWRNRSLASNDDALWVLGWRHAFAPAERWLLQGFAEQAVPVAGPTATRSFAIGGRLWRGAFPSNTFVTDLQLVDSDRDDSVYASVKYTWRLADDWVAALRANATHVQPHGNPDAGTTAYKASAGVGWREPEARRLAALARWTFVGTETDEAASSDRRAHILLAAANLRLDGADSASARWSRRWDRNETQRAVWPRSTTLTLVRWVHELTPRYSASVHLARRSDAVDGTTNGVGAEWGIRLSSKAVLALGLNPRGFDDHEIEVDERLKKGLTIRLRFSIDAALARWLDPPRTPLQ